MIEVFCHSKLKPSNLRRTLDEVSNALYIPVTQDAYRVHSSDIEQGYYYSSEEEYHFSVGCREEFRYWRQFLCFQLYGCSLEKYWTETKQKKGRKKLHELIELDNLNLVIGPRVSAILYKELRDNLEKCYELQFEDKDYEAHYFEQYKHWLKGLRLAADNGCVELC